jgi:hypothetical protein
MPHRTDHVLDQHPPGLPEPSYARLTIESIARVLEMPGNRGRLISEPTLRRAYEISVATTVTVHNLPDPVANTVSERVAQLLPDAPANTTHGTYAQQLRQLAEAV